jgi:dienelactone hydrolase
MKDDTLARCSEIKAELVMIHGTLDNHVPPEGRDLIRKTLRDKGIVFSWYEPAGAQRKSLIFIYLTSWITLQIVFGSSMELKYVRHYVLT